MTSQSLRSLQPPAPARYEQGDLVVGKYRLEAAIGFGGMGTVWRAHNESLGSPLALKLIRDGGGEWPASGSERLLVEARTTASLRHPSIVRVFDFGQTDGGDSFLAMELLAGESLRERIDDRGSLPAIEAVRTLLPILSGLGCAHARGIIHRDLKPDNIFLAHDDAQGVQPKVLDFGIAMLQESVSRLTTAGVLLGSPSYMSPEQALGEEKLDLRVDIWGLAVVLYEAIAGRTPWHARSCPVLLRAIVDDDPPSLVGVGGVDHQLWAILMRGLAKNREARWASTRAFGAALAAWLVGAGVTSDVSGTSLQSAWLGQARGDTRPSLRSIPPSCTSPTVDNATWNLSERHGHGRVWGARPGTWAAAGMALVVMALLFWGDSARVRRLAESSAVGRFDSASASAEGPRFGSGEALPTVATPPAQDPEVVGARERSGTAAASAPAAATGVPVTALPLAPNRNNSAAVVRRDKRSPRIIRRIAPASMGSVEPQRTAQASRPVAREMDFGF